MKNYSTMSTRELFTLSLNNTQSFEKSMAIAEELNKRKADQEACMARCAERNRRDYGYRAY